MEAQPNAQTTKAELLGTIMRWNFGPNRYICSVLDEMRTCNKTRNYAPLESLIEEAQILANRMEAALDDYGDYERMKKAKKELKAELKKLQEKKDGKSKE